MDQDQREDTNCFNIASIDETPQCAGTSQASTSVTPHAQGQRLTEEDSDDQIMARKAVHRQEYSEERQLSLEATTHVFQESDDEEWLSQAAEIGEAAVEEFGEVSDDFDAVLGDIDNSLFYVQASLTAIEESNAGQISYFDLIEEAVKRGQSGPGRTGSQELPLLKRVGKWQSTMVTLTVHGIAGAACHYFNSDLWRYGGRASLLRNSDWHEADSIGLKVCHEHIEVSLHEAESRRSISWGWSSDKNGIFRVRPEHIHVLEMLCGYLNLAAGREVWAVMDGLFAFPDGCSRVSHGGLSQYLSRSFVMFPGVSRPYSVDEAYTYTAGMIDPADVVEALTRVHGGSMERVRAVEKIQGDDCLATKATETGSIEGTLVRLPSTWSECGVNPCVCGDSVMVLDTTQEQLKVRELASGEDYLVISYVWTQHDQSSLIYYIRRAIEVTGVCLVWVDRLCINQRCDQHKARLIPRMREVYQNGYVTVALVPDITQSLPTIFYTPTAILPQENLSLAEPFIAQMEECAWRTRCWTWQEGLLGRRGYYVTQNQVLPARIVSDFLFRPRGHKLRGDKRQLSIAAGLMDSLGVCSLRCQVRTWYQEISMGDLLDAEDHEAIQYWLMPQVTSLGQALDLTKTRTASCPEDQIYSVLGMVPRGEDLQVVYGESRNSILRRAVNAGLIGAEILCSKSVSDRDGESWAAMDDTSQHIGKIYDLAGGMRGFAQIDDKGLRSQFRRLEGLIGAYVDGMAYILRLANSEKEKIRCVINVGWEEELRALVSRMDQILLIEGEKPGQFRSAIVVSGTGQNVVRLATGEVFINPWMKVETTLVWRVVG